MTPDGPGTPAGLWIPTDYSMPKPGVEVPILYRARKNSKPELHLACWCPEDYWGA